MVTGVPSGVSAQFGLAEESTFGTGVTPSRFFEFLTESLKFDNQRIESKALRAGARVLRSDRWATGKKSVAGDLNFEIGNKGFGVLFKHMIGGVSTTQPDAPGAPTVYRHTFTPGDFPVGLTLQAGRPDTAGTIQPFTYLGCRIPGWELNCAVGDFATVKASVLGRDETTATGLATAAYPANLGLFTFVQGAMTIGGASANIKKISIKGTNPMDADRYFLGSALRASPLENGMRLVSGTADMEFESLTAYDRYRNGTEADIVLDLVGPVISGLFNYELKITIHSRFDGETPNVSGPGVVQQGVPFMCVDNSTTSYKFEYTTTDVTP